MLGPKVTGFDVVPARGGGGGAAGRDFGLRAGLKEGMCTSAVALAVVTDGTSLIYTITNDNSDSMNNTMAPGSTLMSSRI